MEMPVKLQDVKDAALRINDYVKHTPIVRGENLMKYLIAKFILSLRTYRLLDPLN